MKKTLFILLAIIVALTAASCNNEKPESADVLTEQDEAALAKFSAETRSGIHYLKRFVKIQEDPETRGPLPHGDGWPSCWGRRSAKIEAFMLEHGITVEDLRAYIAKHKPVPVPAAKME